MSDLGMKLYYAVRYGSGGGQPLEEILSHPDLTTEDFEFRKDSRTALMHAVCDGKLDVVEKLVNAGADIEATCDYNCTPLARAVHNREHSIAAYLYAQGANPYTKNVEGYSAYDYAVKNDMNDFLILVHQTEKQRAQDPNEISLTTTFNHYVIEDIYRFDILHRLRVVRDQKTNGFSTQMDAFKNIQTDTGLQTAFNEHVKRGGIVAEQTVFPDRMVKAPFSGLKPPKN